MELEKVIQEKVNEIISDGSVEKMIRTHIEKSINSALESILQSYSDFGKQVKEAIGKKLEINLTNLNIENYTGMICQIIEDTMKGSALESSRIKVKNHVTEVLQLIEKKHWLLSEVVMQFRDSLYGEGVKVDLEYKEETYGNYIQLGERNSSSFSRSQTKVHDITIHLENKDNNKVFAITNHGKRLSPLNEKPHKWEVFLMQLWVNECTIEIDEDTAQMVANREEDY